MERPAQELSDDPTISTGHMPLSDDGAALRLKDDDDVAVALRPLAPGTAVRFAGEAGPGELAVTITSEIPTGHKFATRAIADGALIRKYGQVIGKASAAIAPGEHVHVHNVEGTRGRGDLAEAAR
jgi:altronate dehydratase small subunit